MQDEKKYIIICWEDNCALQRLIYSQYHKNIYKVIELKKYVEIIPDEINESEKDSGYYLINYNAKMADYMSLSNWANSNMYRFNNNNNTEVIVGSKALIKQGDYIVAGFDIVRFSNIKLPNNKDCINLYKQLTDYPVSLFSLTEDDIKGYVGNNIGHIFYNNFYELGDIKLRKTVKEILPDLGIRHSAIQKLTEE